jgi:TetR/AcrR family transcriptional regulator, copper-responsive repressor
MVQKKSSPQQGRRGRPRQYDPDSALARAAAAFWKNGYAGTSLDDLAAATGMNRPSLYAAFGDKRDLYLKTLERYQQQSRALSAQLLADSATLREFLTRFYDGALELYRAGEADARGCFSISTAPAQATSDPAVHAFLSESIRGTDAFLADVIGKARDRGEIAASGDPSALAQVATATLHTLAVRSRVGVPRHQLKALAAAAIDLICGTAPRQRPRPAGKRGEKGRQRGSTSRLGATARSRAAPTQGARRGAAIDLICGATPRQQPRSVGKRGRKRQPAR